MLELRAIDISANEVSEAGYAAFSEKCAGLTCPAFLPQLVGFLRYRRFFTQTMTRELLWGYGLIRRTRLMQAFGTASGVIREDDGWW